MVCHVCASDRSGALEVPAVQRVGANLLERSSALADEPTADDVGRGPSDGLHYRAWPVARAERS